MTVKKIWRVVRGRKKVSRSIGGNLLSLLFLLIVGFFMIIPLFYAVIQAFKPLDELFAYPPRFFVRRPTLSNFSLVFQLAANLWVPFSRYVFNSVFVSILGTVLYVFIASFAAYPLAKFNFRGKVLISQLIVWTLLFRSDVTAIPQYIIISKFNLINTYSSILLPALAGTFGVFLMKQFMESSVPDTVLEAARLDGASEYAIFWKIIMPSIRPAWLTLVIFTFQGLWNSTGSTYIYDESMKMLPSVLQTISAGGIARAGAGAAVALILMIPPILVFILSQSSVMETMSHSGIK